MKDFIEQVEEAQRPSPAAVQESPASSPSFITILEDPKSTVPWQFTNPDTGAVSDTVFHLRQIPDETNKAFRDRHTTKEYVRGNLRTKVDQDGYGHDLIDYAIVDWEHLYQVKRAADGIVTRTAVPCYRQFKVLLPEVIQGEIIRLCLGKELASALGGIQEATTK